MTDDGTEMLDMRRVLVVVAHPDDEVLGCGATLRRLVTEGASVRVLILGEGSTCRFPREMLGTESVGRAIAERRAFAEQSFSILGIEDAVFGNLPCGRFDTVPIIDLGKTIEWHLADFRPDTVMTHFQHDANSDHRLTFSSVIAATRPIPGSSVRNVLSFETPSSTEWRFVDVFRPSLFVDVTDHIDTKIKAFECYMPTEGRPFPFPRSEIGLMTLVRYRGMQAGVCCAEAFEVVRSVLTGVMRNPL